MPNKKLSKHCPLIVVVSAWATIVLLFSAIYWVLWYGRPDAFIVNKEFNLTPYQELFARLWSSNAATPWDAPSETPNSLAPDIDEFMKLVAQLDITASIALKELEPLRLEQQRLESELQLAAKQNSELLWSNVERYKKKEFKAVEEESRRVEETISFLEKQFGPTPSSQQAIGIANVRVALAEARYREAVKKAKVGEYVLKNLMVFVDPTALGEIRRLEDSLRENSRSQSELTLQITHVRDRAHFSMQQWYKSRKSRLDWIDFLYFSVGVSTTTTFGDIVPNSRGARLTVLFQLIWSVLIVGYLVSLISLRKD